MSKKSLYYILAGLLIGAVLAKTTLCLLGILPARDATVGLVYQLTTIAAMALAVNIFGDE